MSNVINCEQVSFKYNGAHALNGFDLTVKRGEVLALLGPNGVGKTTSIRIINGLLAPESGKLDVLGFNPLRDGSQVRARTGVLTETPALYERLTAWQNLAFFGELSGLSRQKVDQQSRKLLERFNLQQRAGDRVGTFSKGMKQRLALVRALLHDPELLFLDEPTSDLDPEAAKQVQDLILEISRQDNRTVVLCTHRLYEAERLCDRVAIMKSGRVAAAGSLDDLRGQVFPLIQLRIRLAGHAPESYRSLLEHQPGVTGVMLQQGLLEATIADEVAIPAIVRLLVGAGAEIMMIDPHRATLEEIYLRLQHAGGEK